MLVAFLGAREFVLAIDDDDVVLLGQRHGVFDCRIASADDGDVSPSYSSGSSSWYCTNGKIFAGTAQFADIALQADAHDDEIGFNRLAVACI